MKKLRLMIIDSNDSFRLTLEKELNSHYEIHHSRNGHEALEAARVIRPDIIILDLMLTGLDGITLLHALRKENILPMVLIVSKIETPYVFEAAEELGIGYVMRKPCEPKAVAERTLDLSRRMYPENVDPEACITEQLNHLGISPRHKGYGYLLDCTLITIQKPGISLTKELYPTVADRHDTSFSLVERSIRSAINAAWEHSPAKWQEIFHSSDGSPIRPSNGALIAHLAEEIRNLQKKP